MRISAHGLSIDAPSGWEARIFRRGQGMPVLHLATFALFDRDGDFGGAATARMAPDDAFAALVEYRVDDAVSPGVGLFARAGMSRLREWEFSPARLQVTRAGHLGSQRFFTQAGRPCCLYCVVRPGRLPAGRLVRRLSSVLGSLEIGPQAGPPATSDPDRPRR